MSKITKRCREAPLRYKDISMFRQSEVYEHICVDPITPVIGAEVSCVNLAQISLPDVLQEIHLALMRHQVLFFHNQDITPAEFSSWAGQFGRLRKARRAAFELLEEAPEVAVIVNDKDRPPNVNHFHSDGIFRKQPEFASILYSKEVPEYGGDTVFVSMTAAYEALSPDMKSYLAPKSATQDFMKLHGSATKARSWKGENAVRMKSMAKDHPPITHPIVRKHPVTGLPSLYVSESFTRCIDGVTVDESNAKLLELYRHYERPEFQCRFRWRPNSIAFWDNRATLHYAVADYWPQKRLMHRLTIETDAFGSDG